MSQFYWCSLQLGGWPIAPIPDEYRKVQPSNVEALLVGGNVDFSTSIMTATNELLPFLENAEQVTLSEFGHTDDIWDLQPEATTHLLTTYYDTGEVDDSYYTYQPMNFNVGLMSFPLLIKVALVVIVLVSIGLVVLLWFSIRRIRVRRSSASQVHTDQ